MSTTNTTPPPAVADPDTEIERILTSFNRGKTKEAAQELEGLLPLLSPTTTAFSKAALILGQFYEHLGESEKALSGWKAAVSILDKAFTTISTNLEEFQNLYISVCYNTAMLAERAGREGSGVVHKKKTVCYGPTKTASPEEEEMWKKTRMNWAIEYLNKALQCLSDDDAESKFEFRTKVADIYKYLGNYPSAMAIYEQAHQASPSDWHWLDCWADCLLHLGKHEEGLQKLNQILEAHPSCVPAYEKLIAYCKKHEKDNEAKLNDLKEKMRFYQWVPNFCARVTMTPENAVLVSKLSSGETALDCINNELRNDFSLVKTELLAATCWHHYHGPVDDAGFSALENHALNSELREQVVDVLFKLVENHGSVCTIKGALDVLATTKHPRVFNLMMNLLPQDVQHFPMDVPRALGKLKDPRAIPALIKFVGLKGRSPDREEIDEADDDDDDDDDIFAGFGKGRLRETCLIALTQFSDNQEAASVLEAALHDIHLRGIALAAMWVLSRKQEYLQALEEQANEGNLDFRAYYYLREEDNANEETKKILDTHDRVKKERDEKKREAEERGVVDWCPTEEQLQQWKTSGKVNMANEKAQKIHPLVFELTSITELDLGNNRLREIPPEISVFTNLRELNFQSNRLEGPLSDSISELTSLSRLGFHGNKLTTFPESLTKLTNLAYLSISHNKLEDVSPVIWQLTTLKELSLEYNKLTALPADVANLKNLENLRLSGNKIKQLPDSFGDLVSLREVFLYNNSLITVPESLSRLTNLTRCNLTSNPIPPENVHTWMKGNTVFSYDKPDEDSEQEGQEKDDNDDELEI